MSILHERRLAAVALHCSRICESGGQVPGATASVLLAHVEMLCSDSSNAHVALGMRTLALLCSTPSGPNPKPQTLNPEP